LCEKTAPQHQDFWPVCGKPGLRAPRRTRVRGAVSIGTISWRGAQRKSCPTASSTGTTCCLARGWTNKRARSKKKCAWQDTQTRPEIGMTHHAFLKHARVRDHRPQDVAGSPGAVDAVLSSSESIPQRRPQACQSPSAV